MNGGPACWQLPPMASAYFPFRPHWVLEGELCRELLGRFRGRQLTCKSADASLKLQGGIC